MESDLLKILTRFRDVEDPDMGSWGDKPYETLSKSECMEILSTYNINGLELCRIGNINPVPETLCKLAFFASQICEKNSADDQPAAKKQKKGDQSTVRKFVIFFYICFRFKQEFKK